MITKSKAAVNTVAFVPNTAKGQKFISDLRRYLNHAQFKVRLKGRHENRKELAEQTGLDLGQLWRAVPLKHATYFAVYVDGIGRQAENLEQTQRLWARIVELNSQLQAKKAEVRELWEKQRRALDAEWLLAHPTWPRVWQDVKRLILEWWCRPRVIVQIAPNDCCGGCDGPGGSGDCPVHGVDPDDPSESRGTIKGLPIR